MCLTTKCISASRSAIVALLVATAAAMPLPRPAVAAQATADWPVRMRHDIALLGRIEWRLREAGGQACSTKGADIGVSIDDRRAYDRRDWPLLERSVGLRDTPMLVDVAPDSPAARAGLHVGDEILAVNGENVDAIVHRRTAGALVADVLLEEIAAADADALLRLSIRRDGRAMDVAVLPVRHCAARLVLVTDRGVDAHSDARNVAISSGLLALASNDDEIALAAGHELAHIILGHRKGGGISARRRMEDDADSLGLRLMHCAGYDPVRGLGLFRQLGKGDWLGFLRAPTHRSFAKRVVRLEAEVPALSCPVGVIAGHSE
jgi:hypothetical protein